MIDRYLNEHNIHLFSRLKKLKSLFNKVLNGCAIVGIQLKIYESGGIIFELTLHMKECISLQKNDRLFMAQYTLRIRDKRRHLKGEIRPKQKVNLL